MRLKIIPGIYFVFCINIFKKPFELTFFFFLFFLLAIRDHAEHEKAPWSMHDHDTNFFGGGRDDPAPTSSIADGGPGVDAERERDDSAVAGSGVNGRHRDPFQVRRAFFFFFLCGFVPRESRLFTSWIHVTRILELVAV